MGGAAPMNRPAAETVQRVLEALQQFLFPPDLQDDATLMAMKTVR